MAGYELRSQSTFQSRGRGGCWKRGRGGFSDQVSGIPSQRQTSPLLSADRLVSCDSDLGQIQIVFAISCI